MPINILTKGKFMGLAASQARLLSLTTRINNNEMESLLVSNSKIRLADKNSAAKQNYLAALDATKYEFIYYDSTGVQNNTAFTFNAVTQYQSMKNQYSFHNAAGQILVSSSDANKFEQSANLYEFLDKYGLFDQSKEEFQEQLDEYNAQMDEYNKQKAEYDQKLADYEKKYQDYVADLEAYNKELEAYNKEMQNYYAELDQYNKDYQEYLDALNKPDLYAKFSDIVGTSDNPTAFCYRMALGGDSGCYMHLLNLILDFNGSSPTRNTYTASNGKQVTTNGATGGMGTPAAMKDVSDALNETNADGTPTRVCDGDDDLNTEGDQNMLAQAKAAGKTPTELEVLMSDYVDNGDGTYSLKSLKQKAIDMYYILQNMSGSVDAADMKNMLINFTDGDMQKLTLPEPTPPTLPNPPEAFTGVKPTFDEVAPNPPEMPEYTEKIYDKPLAQWYINLWYAMDADSIDPESDTLYTVHKEDEKPYYTVPNVVKETTDGNKFYEVIDEDKANDEQWLNFALNKGMITMTQAVAPEDSEHEITWNSIIHTNVSDLVEVEDTEKIAKAEAEYQKSVTEVQIEDKKFDIELKKLDTEHNALQQQFEAIKSVMDKNTERTFKTFS